MGTPASSGQGPAGVDGLRLVAGAKHMESIEATKGLHRIFTFGRQCVRQQHGHTLARPCPTKLTAGTTQCEAKIGYPAPTKGQHITKDLFSSTLSALLLQHHGISGERNHRNVAPLPGGDEHTGSGNRRSPDGMAVHRPAAIDK